MKINTPEHPDFIPKNAALYFNTGYDYSENEKYDFSFTGDEVEITCQIPENTIDIRLDPIENYGCIVNNLEILSYNGIVKYEPLNGYKNDNGDMVFVNTDPQIELKGVEQWIKIKYHIFLLTDSLLYRVFGSLLAERDRILNSRSWDITKPLKEFIAFLRPHKRLKAFKKRPKVKRLSLQKKNLLRKYFRINGSLLGVQVHIFYLDLIDEIIKNLNNIPFPFHCYISTDTDEKVGIIKEIFSKRCKNAKKIYVEKFENRGRDVAPFIEQMKKYINKYEFILHIHSKKSFENLDKHGDNWRKYLYEYLLGSTENIYRIFYDFISNENLGLVFSIYPPIKQFMLWAGGKYGQEGKENVINFLKKLGIEMTLDEKPYFPAGNMFWARTKSIEKVFNSNINKNDFPDENNQKDLTLAHAIERSWVYIVQNQGYSFKEILEFS